MSEEITKDSLIETPQVSGEHGLGRVFLEDSEDQNYLMRNFMTVEEPRTLPSYKYYTTASVMDQGTTPQCVEFSWNGWLMAYPIKNKKIEPRKTIYCAAQKLDPWPGDCDNPQYDGTSVRAGAKVLQSRGLIGSYLWAFTTADMANWLLSGKGPIVMGTRWYRSMRSTDKKGILRVDTNSGLDGGHAYLCIGYNSKTRMFRFLNSWGTGWGQRGRFWMSADDVEKLLQMQGEACTAVEQRLTA